MSDSTPFDPSRYLTKVGSADYLEVKWRLVWLRELHPDASINTECLADNDQRASFRCHISIPGGGSATGHGNESLNDFREYYEKAETKAVGRALAALGFGTQFCQDFDFSGGSGAVVDSPIDFASTRGRRMPAPTPAINGNGHHAPTGPGVTQAQLNYISKLANESGLDDQQIDEWCLQRDGVGVALLDKRQASSFIETLQAQARVNK